MPRGVPKNGKRAPGGGRPKKYGEATKQMWVPLSIADKLSDLCLFLAELDSEIEAWENIIGSIDLKKNPRYSQAKLLTDSIREKIGALDIDLNSVIASDESEK